MNEETIVKLNVVSIFTSPAMGAPMIEHHEIHAVSGMGLSGDRYFVEMANGAYSEKRIGKPGRIKDSQRQVSLISLPGILAANALLHKEGVEPFQPIHTRRNLVVAEAAEFLNALAGRTFMVNSVMMRGVELCPPCSRPPGLIKRAEHGSLFESAFENRGGLRAEILTTGQIALSGRLK